MLTKPPSIKKGGYATSDKGILTCICMQNIRIVMNIFTNCLWADGQTHIVIMVQTQRSCNILNTVAKTCEKVLR